MNYPAVAYAILRVTFGINFVAHVIVRMGHFSNFVEKLVELFHKTILPDFLVRAFGYAATPLEGLIGILLILGLFTPFACILGAILMASLMFGMCLQQDWNTVGIELIYVIIYYILISQMDSNKYSLDRGLTKKEKIGF